MMVSSTWWRPTVVVVVLASTMAIQLAGQRPDPRPVSLDDLFAIREVSDPQISPDGAWVVYTVTRPDTVEDQLDSDLWMTSWDGSQNVRLTTSAESEHSARWSPDGRSLAFLSSRGDSNEVDQVWLLDRRGGEAERLTSYPGGVSDLVWAPVGRRLALVVDDPSPHDSDEEQKHPIVIDRLQFKEDETGYLAEGRSHLYSFDVESRRSVLLTPGSYNELLPSWAPDGSAIAFVSKRRNEFDRDNNWDIYVVPSDSGATPVAVTTFDGADGDPDYESRPVFSPDGTEIAYLRGGRPEMIWYDVQRLAVSPRGGGDARVPTEALDRSVWTPQWTPDGESLLFLLEDDRSTHLARIPARGGRVERLVSGRRFVSAFSLSPQGRIALLASTPDRPAEVFALDGEALRQLSHQNDAWLETVRLVPVEEIDFPSEDGTQIGGFVVRPIEYRPGERYPTVLRIHGGPVYQFSNEFDFTWQLLAAEGYAVVAANPRGSSGRGEEFQRAIYADWGNLDAQDVLAAVDHVAALGIADTARLGVGGWSYGGMLTNYVIARDSRFKAAVSGSSISNILAGYGTDQYIREYEIELGRPWEQPDVWMRVSYPFFHADRITTPTLFLCGELDFNVPLLNSEQMYQALRSLGRETQLVIYPGEYHSIRRPSFQRDRLQRYVAWYDRFLRPEHATSTPDTP